MPEIRHTITIDAPRDRVAALVSTPAGLAVWWAEDVDPVPDSPALNLGFFDRATVYRLVPRSTPHEVRWRCETGQAWTGTELVFRLQDKGAQTQLEFSHEGWPEPSPYFVSCNTVWGHLMFKLKDVAERGGPPRPLFTKSGMETSTTGAY
jgi:hypothetical protein